MNRKVKKVGGLCSCELTYHMASFIPHQRQVLPVTYFCQQSYHYWKHSCRHFPSTTL